MHKKNIDAGRLWSARGKQLYYPQTAERRMIMAKYIDREALVEWLKRIPLKDLSDGRGLCRVIFEDDLKRAIKKIPKGIIVYVAPVRHGRWETEMDDMGWLK